MSRLAPVVPHACSGCFQQKINARHVDFDVAYDGPVLYEGAVNYPIDDLILCEDCLRDAGKHVGLGDVERAEEARDAALSEATEANARAEAAESRLQAMEHAVSLLKVDLSPATEKPARQRRARGDS